VHVTVCCDTDFAGDVSSRKSTTCVVAMVNGMFVTATCKTQLIIATSSGEAELYGIGSALLEALGLRTMLHELKHEVLVQVLCDSSSARAIALRRGFGRLKHLDVKWLWVQDVLKMKDIKLAAIASVDNLADIGTKMLAAARLRNLSEQLGLEF
jgi:hypothetical protein